MKKTKEFVLWFEQVNECKLAGFCDAEFARDVGDRHSTSGYAFIFGGDAIS